ncbi:MULTISPECIES: hypothetical protein [Kocuria]|uniref:hypothetical protein n=1 Tax=Kocuria TaxID=57493 RepID=UPI00203D4EAD|nr:MULTISPECIES: hypothetical protein [Kocuria]MCM3687966.1 hypothetical protein [Kocuria rosea]HST72082.1 hypothetical protein [Kocuria rosea]
MKIAARKKLKRAGLSAAAVAALLSATGCSAINPVATADVGYAPADGIVLEMSTVQLTDMLIVAKDAESPGRLLGSISNISGDPVTVSVNAGGATAQVEVPAGETYLLENETPVILDPAGADPGRMVKTEFSASGESGTESVPVLDHTFERYAEFIPGGAPTTPANPSNTPALVEGQVGEGGGEEAPESQDNGEAGQGNEAAGGH